MNGFAVASLIALPSMLLVVGCILLEDRRARRVRQTENAEHERIMRNLQHEMAGVDPEFIQKWIDAWK